MKDLERRKVDAEIKAENAEGKVTLLDNCIKPLFLPPLSTV